MIRGRKTPHFLEEVKYEEQYSLETEEEKPPSLEPPPPISQFPCHVARFSKPGNGNSEFNPFDDTDSSSVERYNEEVSIRFMFGNGRPLSTIDDPHFQNFLQYLNPDRTPPEAGNMTTKAMLETRPDIKYQRSNGPLGVTIEAIRKSDEIFLSISVHCYNEYGIRQNTVHFEKIIIADYEGKVVADRIRRVVDSKKAMNFGISFILSPNLRMLKMVSDNMPFKNKFVCFFSYISNIAREVIHYPEFTSGLNVLREYVGALHKHREVLTKFKKMQMDTNNSFGNPALDSDTDWLTTLHFLATCSQHHETFLNLHETWCMPKYINANEENAISNLFDFLVVLCHVTTEICSEDSCASQVLFSMSIINNAIKTCGIKSVREKMRKTFNKYYSAISKGAVGDFYTIASLLDPRYGYSKMIFSDDNWKVIEQKLVNLKGIAHYQLPQMEKEIRKYRILHEKLPAFDEATTPSTWWNEHQKELPLMYRQWIEYSTIPAVAIDGKHFFSQGGKLAHLFATLDEEISLKAVLLAQSSQDFVGRGSSSNMVYSQINGNQFKRIEEVDDVNMEESIKKESEEKQDPKPTLTDIAEQQEEHSEEKPENYLTSGSF